MVSAVIAFTLLLSQEDPDAQARRILDQLKKPSREKWTLLRDLRDLGARPYAKEVAAYLADLDAQTRKWAILTLAEWRCDEFKGQIARLLTRDGRHVQQALIALSKLGSRTHVKQIAGLLKSENGPLIAEAIRTLAHLEATEYSEAIAALLESPDSIVRSAACRGLAELRAKESRSEVLALVDDRQQFVRASAVSAMGRLGSADDIKRLSSLLRDSDPGVRAAAAEALAERGAGDSATEISRRRKDPFPICRAAAARSLGALKKKEHAESIRGLLQDEWMVDGERVRDVAERALKRLE